MVSLRGTAIGTAHTLRETGPTTWRPMTCVSGQELSPNGLWTETEVGGWTSRACRSKRPIVLARPGPRRCRQGRPEGSTRRGSWNEMLPVQRLWNTGWPAIAMGEGDGGLHRYIRTVLSVLVPKRPGCGEPPEQRRRRNERGERIAAVPGPCPIHPREAGRLGESRGHHVKAVLVYFLRFSKVAQNAFAGQLSG